MSPVIDWLCVFHCLFHTNVKHVHLVINVHYDDPNPHIDISHLFLLVPIICCLETSHGHIVSNQNLVKFVWKIINTFQQLAKLTLNKEGIHPFKLKINLTIEQGTARFQHMSNNIS
jgi:hypothetical protein